MLCIFKRYGRDRHTDHIYYTSYTLPVFDPKQIITFEKCDITKATYNDVRDEFDRLRRMNITEEEKQQSLDNMRESMKYEPQVRSEEWEYTADSMRATFTRNDNELRISIKGRFHSEDGEQLVDMLTDKLDGVDTLKVFIDTPLSANDQSGADVLIEAINTVLDIENTAYMRYHVYIRKKYNNLKRRNYL